MASDFSSSSGASGKSGNKRPSGGWQLIAWRSPIPDPRGLVGFGLVAGAFLSYTSLDPGASQSLFSDHPLLEILGHAWLLLAPPLGAWLGLRHLLVRGDSLLPLLSVPLGALMTLLSAVGIAWGLLLG